MHFETPQKRNNNSRDSPLNIMFQAVREAKPARGYSAEVL